METCWWLLAGTVLLPLVVLLRSNGKNKTRRRRRPCRCSATCSGCGTPPPTWSPSSCACSSSTSALLGASDNIITRACYGPTWRLLLLRRNLVSETLHPSRVRLFAPARAWVRRVLAEKLRDAPVGSNRLDEPAVCAIERAERAWLLFIARKLSVFFFFPSVTKRLFRGRLREAHALRRRQRELFVPLINARREYKKLAKEGRAPARETTFEHSYVDTLLDVALPDEDGNHRPLIDDDIVTLCSEFLNAGTDTTSTGLQWIMAELVKNPAVQDKLHD
ncbi:hypothetical protein PR202_ga07581 [Eleusine coracana subsp. coracana]|uniref:Cytochrome P450 89A2 n=1 Tax=Eleusine coracana subsp. coracana TaxID=191504 RepID=A0AAV5BZL1_ELECO|nr:hypothetical protein PR202_ga07581 [Eleusine coracana subsp. coracana]